LHWAGIQSADAERALKHALLKAYFTDGRDVSSREVLAAVAGEAGLDAQRARAVLDSDEYAQDVRKQERLYQEAGISAVPSVIINDRHLIQGG
ncbi:thioredoxin domain-containing protein, partial [Salinisphaera sp. USBA-960]|nr:thioredoxin domain-containing protein [Salifodinibacter halophilus]